MKLRKQSKSVQDHRSMPTIVGFLRGLSVRWRTPDEN
jgi:hypothetical protein